MLHAVAVLGKIYESFICEVDSELLSGLHIEGWIARKAARNTVIGFEPSPQHGKFGIRLSGKRVMRGNRQSETLGRPADCSSSDRRIRNTGGRNNHLLRGIIHIVGFEGL